MTTIRDYNARTAGLPWVRKEDYAAFLAIMEDADGLPATWEKFAQLSEEGERAMKADGLIVERANIDPETFPYWCAAHGYGVNSQGRMAFAAEFVGKKYGTNQS
jgi:hypothetical protein